MLTSPAPSGATVAAARPRGWRGDDPLLRTPLWHAAAISIVAFVVILWTAPHGLWLDEATSVRIASLPLPSFLRFVTDGGEPNMALFHALLWPVAQLDASDRALRVLPIAFGSLALGATYLLGRRLFDTTTAVVAIILLAVHGFTTRYATEVRGYSLMVLLTLLAALVLHRAVTERRRRWWVCYAVLAVLAYFSHELALLTIGAQLLSLLALGRKTPWRPALAVGAVVGIAFVGWRIATSAANRTEGVRWIPTLSTSQVTDTLRVLTGGSNATLVLVGAFVVAGMILAFLRLRADGPGPQTWPGILIASSVVVPVGAALVLSTVQPMFLARYFQAVLPPMALLVGTAMSALPRRPVLAIAFTTVLAALVVAQHPDLDTHDRGGSDEAAAYLAENVQPGDAVFLPYNEELGALQWYAAERLPAGVIDARPGSPADALYTDWWWDEPRRMGDGLADEAAIDPESWRRSLASFDRVWVISGFLDENPKFVDTGSAVVPEGRNLCSRESFGTADVSLWARSCD